MKIILTIVLVLGGLASHLWAKGPQVVVSLAPLHSLVSDLMIGVEAPDLLLRQEVSGHDYTLKPSQVRLLEKADLVVWIGPQMETFLTPLAFTKTDRSFQLTAFEGLAKWPRRRACGAHTHECQGQDPHVWLSIDVMSAFVRLLAQRLQELDPQHQALYGRNLAALEKKLDALRADLKATFAPSQGKPFFVFHDAFQYLEKEFALGPSLHLTLDPEQGTSLKQLRLLQKEVLQYPGSCLLAEATLGQERVERLAHKLGLRAVLVDPLGFDRVTHQSLDYGDMMRTLAADFARCFAIPEVTP